MVDPRRTCVVPLKRKIAESPMVRVEVPVEQYGLCAQVPLRLSLKKSAGQLAYSEDGSSRCIAISQGDGDVCNREGERKQSEDLEKSLY